MDKTQATVTETELMNARSAVKALTLRKDKFACNIAKSLGFEGYFSSSELDLDDPRIDPYDKKKFIEYNRKLYDATWKLDKLTCLKNNDLPRHYARQTCYDFINLLSLEDAVSFIEKAGCSNTIELVEALIKNPNLLDELVLSEEEVGSV